MAENEIIDLGHKRHWSRLRRSLRNADCSVEDVVTAATEDIELMCRGLPKAMRKGPSLALLLEPALGSALQTQAVLAQFTEKGLATLVQNARKLARSNDPRAVATAAATHLIQSLVSQIEGRAGRETRFREGAAKQELMAGITATFGGYQQQLTDMLEGALRNATVPRFKRQLQPRPRLSAPQLASMSVMAAISPGNPRAR